MAGNPEPKQCPSCGQPCSVSHCFSVRCDWLYCTICEIVFAVAGVAAGHSFPKPS